MLQHVAVPKPQHAHTQLIQSLSSFLVIFRVYIIGMLPAVQLNGKQLLHAIEIDDVAVDGILPAKLKAAQLSAAQDHPHALLSISTLAAHSFRKLKELAAWVPWNAHALDDHPTSIWLQGPHPNPLPA